MPSTKPGSERLAQALDLLQRRLVLSIEQPPAPGSHWLARGWAGATRVAGRALAAVPKTMSAWGLFLRLLLTAVIWLLLIGLALEVIVLWVIVVLPVQALVRRSTAPSHTRSGAMASAAATPPLDRPVPPPPPPAFAAVELQSLKRLPDPTREPALATCAMCGGSTQNAHDGCLFCGTRLPMISARGWHRDPAGPGRRRWHDGTTWTSFVESAPELLHRR